ncbi:3'-5' exonuclease [uncultured Endozoicomonas sp.]|uniref:3'-5' exonuclease n=1 Tax=uncultured Endozoicomonas sp. TaxID=432652 RepID=UPI0026263FE0|nr:3'-5' exonuclease [uncultured Endozoicomonas sp.]
MLIQLFDTETTGLPKDWRAPMTDLDNWPRIIQLAYLVFDLDGNEVGSFNELIKPDGWTMPTEKFWIDNGFSQEKSEAEGIPIADALGSFITDYNKADALVAHNISYDYNVTGAELLRAGIRAGKKNRQFCTKEIGTDFCQLPGNYGKYKWPTLSELHNKLFGCDFDNAHDALADVRATANCFFELVRLGEIKIEEVA